MTPETYGNLISVQALLDNGTKSLELADTMDNNTVKKHFAGLISFASYAIEHLQWEIGYQNGKLSLDDMRQMYLDEIRRVADSVDRANRPR